MYKTTALMLSLMLTSMPVLADCMAQLDRFAVATPFEPLRTIGGLRKHHQATSHR